MNDAGNPVTQTLRTFCCQSQEHEAAKWLAPDELDSVDWLPTDVEVVEKLKKLL